MDDAAALTLAELSIGEYAPLRSAYKTEVGGAILEYLLTDNAKVTKFNNAMKQAIAEYVGEAFWMGYRESGGDDANPVKADQDWLNAKQKSEWGYCDMLFQQLKELKADPEMKVSDFEAEANRRAENYAKTLDGVFNEGRLRGSKDIMLTFGGRSGNESCATCQKLMGQRHRKSWWIRKGLTLYRGNTNYDCGVYACEHLFYDDKGQVWTI